MGAHDYLTKNPPKYQTDDEEENTEDDPSRKYNLYS